MSERDYVRSLRRHWRLALACVVLAVLAAVLYTAAATPVYRSTATLFVSIRIDDPGSAYQAGMFTQQRVQSYAAILDTPQVLEEVIARLGLSHTPSELATMVSAEAPLESVLLKVTAEADSAALARDIANETAAVFGSQVAELENAAGNDVSPVEVTLVRPADLPTSSTGQPTVNLALAVLLGALIGFGAAVLRDTLDHTVRADELEERLGIAVLAQIPFDKGIRRSPLVVEHRPHSGQAEEFRRLGATLQFFGVEPTPRSIVVASAREGEGTTTTVCNLAVVLAQAGNSVILVSGDLHHPGVEEIVGMPRSPGLSSVVAGQATLDEALRPWGDPELPLQVLPSGLRPQKPGEVLGSKKLHELLRDLEDRADFVLIDVPPVLPYTDAAVVSAVASGVLLVVRGGRTRYDDVSWAARALDAVGARVLGAVVTTPPRRNVAAPARAAWTRSTEPSVTAAPGEPADEHVDPDDIADATDHVDDPFGARSLRSPPRLGG
jgi:capsular exopolysaccharide synthesis family protein